MKILLEATDEISRQYGGVKLEAKKGEKVTLSPSDAEIALATGSFLFVKEVTENEIDEAAAAGRQFDLEAQKTELLKLSKTELQERAKDLPGYRSNMNMPELADLILSPQPPVVVTDAQFTPPAGETGE